MRKTLSIILAVLVLGGVFTGGWYLTGGQASDPQQAGPTTTVESSTTSVVASPTTAAPNVIDIANPPAKMTKAANLGMLARDTDLLLRRLNVNPLAIGRIVTYAAITYHDSYRDSTIDPLLVQQPGGASAADALVAAGVVVAELSGVDSMKTDVDGWLESLTPNAQAIVAAVLERANADGFNEAASVKAPTFATAPAWKPGNRTYPGGLEPGWGLLKPILTDITKCPVAKAPVERIADERTKVLAAIKASDFDRNTPQVAEALLEATGSLVMNVAIAFGEYNGTMKPFMNNEPLSPKMSLSLRALVGGYDAIIALWNAKWVNGVAAPMDLHLVDSTQPGLTTSAPSYPSTAATMTSFVSHLAELLGGQSLTDSELAAIPSVPLFKIFVEAKNARVLNWTADVDAGDALGRCMAEQTLASRKG